MKATISSSITDFPLFSRVETFFQKFEAAGVDSVELVIGVKSRWNFASIINLSHKYHLPITTVHQPAWSGLNLWFDEKFITLAVQAGCRRIVFHPLTFCYLKSEKMARYFALLAGLQEKYKIQVLLENMPCDELPYRALYKSSVSTETHLGDIYAIAKEYNFSINFDTSHAKFIQPHKKLIFKRILPYIGNIHLSSFTDVVQHLPITLGNLDANGFLSFLQAENYKGLLTFEIYHPRKRSFLYQYDFLEVEKSVKLVKEILDK